MYQLSLITVVHAVKGENKREASCVHRVSHVCVVREFLFGVKESLKLNNYSLTIVIFYNYIIKFVNT